MWTFFNMALTPIWEYGQAGTEWSFFNGFWLIGVPVVITVCSGIWLITQALAQRKRVTG